MSGLTDDRGTSDGARLVCGDASFEEGERATMPPLDTLPDDVLAAVDDLGEPALNTSLDWHVATADDDELVLIREFDPDEPAAARGDTHGTARPDHRRTEHPRRHVVRVGRQQLLAATDRRCG